MSSPQYSVVFSAPVAGTVTAGSVGDVLIPDATSGLYVKATTANRGTRRSTGIALSAYATGGVTDIQQYGQVDTVTAGLGAGSASWVRVSATGSLERAAVSGSDDVVGWVETDGTFHAVFGFLTAAIVNGSGGATVPTGTGIPHIVGGAQNAASSLIVDADVTSVGVAKLTGLGANVATFLATPSGANLASALTSALTVAKGGTGLTSLTIPASALLVGTTDTQTLTNKTLTSPTINTGAIDGGRVEADSFRLKGVITNATTGNQNDIPRAARIRCTNDGLNITGIDATGAEDGEVVQIIAATSFVTGMTIVHQSASSAAANRIISWTAATINMLENAVISLQYDATTQRWRFMKDGF